MRNKVFHSLFCTLLVSVWLLRKRYMSFFISSGLSLGVKMESWSSNLNKLLSFWCKEEGKENCVLAMRF